MPAYLLLLFALSVQPQLTFALDRHGKSEVTFIQGIQSVIASLDPYALTGIEAYSVTNYLVEPLATIDPTTKKLVPHLAESWTFAKDKKSFQIKLRTNVKFHDGASLKPEDVKFSWESYYRPEYKAEMWQGMWEAVESVKVLGPREVEVAMKEARYQTFVNFITTLRILPQQFYSKVDRSQWRESMIGTGPYELVGLNANRGLELKPFKEWWGWKHFKITPGPRLLIKTVGDSTLAAQMLKKNELDFYQVSGSKTARLPSQSLQKIASVHGEGFGLELNLKNPLFENLNVRRALLLLWNREVLKEKLYGPDYALALDSFSSAQPYYPRGVPENQDAKTALKLLKEAGWEDHDQNSVLDKDGREFRFKVLVKTEEGQRWLSFYQADAKKVGIAVEIERVEEDAQYWNRVKQMKFDALGYEGGLSEAVHSTVWKSTAPYNYVGFKNVEVDQKIEQLETEFDEIKRARAQRDLILLVRQTRSQIPGLSTLKAQALVSKRIEIDHKSPTFAWRWRPKDRQNR